jgi:hypothetical protein
MVVATLALLIALGGTSYAAIAIPPHSITARQIKPHSLLALDFKSGQLPRGAQGPAGPAGPAGPQGPAGPAGTGSGVALKWAVVRADGGIVSQSGGITLAAKPGTGQYILNFGSSVSGKPILATSASAGGDTVTRGATSASPCGGGSDGVTCTGADVNTNVLVSTRDATGAAQDHAFVVAVFG